MNDELLRHSKKTLNLFIVDDEVVQLRLIREIVEKVKEKIDISFNVFEIDSVCEMVAQGVMHIPDLILLDLNLCSRYNGLKTYKLSRSLYPFSSLIVVSGVMLNDEQKEYIKDSDFVAKTTMTNINEDTKNFVLVDVILRNIKKRSLFQEIERSSNLSQRIRVSSGNIFNSFDEKNNFNNIDNVYTLERVKKITNTINTNTVAK